MITLDETDTKILWRLDLDGRLPLTDLAAQVGISKQALNYRMKRLIENEFILGHIGIIDIHRLGLLTYRLYLRFSSTDPDKTASLITYLKEHTNTLFVGTMHGSWDAEAVFTVRNYIHFSEILKDIKGSFGKVLHRVDVSMTPVVYTFRRDYLVEPTREYTPLPSYGFEPVPHGWDDLDFGILEALASDCRITYDDLADRMGTSSQTIKNRIRRLEDDTVIRGYRTNINFSLLGRRYVKALLHLAPMTRKREQSFYAACARYSSVVYLTEVMGQWQLEIEAEVQDIDELYTMIGELRSAFPGTIVDFQTVHVDRDLKLNYLPSGRTTREIIAPAI